MKRILITGAARRIGSSVSRALASDGWHVIAHYNTSEHEAQALADEIKGAGGQCDIVQADLSKRSSVMAMIPDCVARFGRLDALINNASNFCYDTLNSVTPESWDAHVVPNLESPVFLAKDFAGQCGGQSGCVINILDHKVTALNPDFFSYTIGKIGLTGATHLLAQSLVDTGIRVNGIAPGITLVSGKQTQKGFERAWTAPPLGRSSTPAEIASACRFVLETGSLNGQLIVLDGGDSLLERQRDIAFEN